MKAYLLYPQQDFDFAGDLPPNHEDLIQDLELDAACSARWHSEIILLFDIARKVMLEDLVDPKAILYRQRVLADCIAEPDIIREMYAIAVEALQDKRGLRASRRRIPRPSSPEPSDSSKYSSSGSEGAPPVH